MEHLIDAETLRPIEPGEKRIVGYMQIENAGTKPVKLALDIRAFYKSAVCRVAADCYHINLAGGYANSTSIIKITGDDRSVAIQFPPSYLVSTPTLENYLPGKSYIKDEPNEL